MLRFFIAALSALMLLGCFPKNYHKHPDTGEVVEVKKLDSVRKVCRARQNARAVDRSVCSTIRVEGRSTYEIIGRSLHVQTAPCSPESGNVRWGMWEELIFEDGTRCPVTKVYPGDSMNDFARPAFN